MTLAAFVGAVLFGAVAVERQGMLLELEALFFGDLALTLLDAVIHKLLNPAAV